MQPIDADPLLAALYTVVDDISRTQGKGVEVRAARVRAVTHRKADNRAISLIMHEVYSRPSAEARRRVTRSALPDRSLPTGA